MSDQFSEQAPIGGRDEEGTWDRRWLYGVAGLVVLVLFVLWGMFGPGRREADGTETWYWWLIWFVAPVGSGLGLYFAYYFYRQMMTKDEGSERMREIAAAVRAGAAAYIRRQYSVVAVVFVVLVVILVLVAFVGKAQSRLVPFAFL
ncbi:MAG: sodium/proton-translocating pyrophosphatase, partial [Planctomycetes bacterium]|nr:sodium/proton-translocating pyrophosphatase [Planctomycetota bacterium]